MAQGYIVTPNVSFVNNGVRVVADLVASLPTFPLPDPQFAVEVKTGNGGYTNNQSIVYPNMNSGDTVVPVGFRALQAGFIPGVPVTISVKTERYPGQ